LKADIAPEHPLYRWYLAGGPQSLRISWSGAGLVFGLGLLARVAGSAGTGHDRVEALAAVLAAAGAVAVAAFTARWVGARKGLLAGFAIAVSLWTLGDSAPLARLSVESIWVALAAFALGNVPGRLGPLRRPWVPVLFWAALAVSTALTGVVGPCYVLVASALYLIATQDSRGVRFLLHVRGIVFMAAVIACLLAARHIGFSLQPPLAQGDLTSVSLATLATTLLMASLPWSPLALPGLVLVVREGHCFLPFWRLLACWVIVPIGLAGTGLYWSNACLAAVLPPLAVLAAMAADDGLHRLRRLSWFKRRPVRATA
jgi:hypothetical protein